MTKSTIQDIVAKVWSLCDVLRDDGITYHQYVNELTYLLFLKMAEETKTERLLLPGCKWRDLVEVKDDPSQQLNHYLRMLADLGTNGKGRVKQIFANPTTFLHQPDNLTTLVSEIDSVAWHDVGRENLGAVYEGLLEKNAGEKKSGAGQYFTPRPLIECIVKLVKPKCGELIVDPALGTGKFLIEAQRFALANANAGKRKKPKFFGVELVRDTHRLALMNAMLHKLDGKLELGDALAADGIPMPEADVVLTNPPFGSKRGAGRKMRDLPFPTSNKQLAFLQLICASLKPLGRAAVVLPDNVLFEDGVGQKIRADLMDKCNLHTILRLPTGIFYAAGVKTNVLFFTRGKKDKGTTKRTWVFDLRSGMPSFGKRNRLQPRHFAEFEKCFGRKPDGTSQRHDQGDEGRFSCFDRESIADRGDNLNMGLLDSEDKSEENGLSSPEDIAALIRDRLTFALDEVESLASMLESAE